MMILIWHAEQKSEAQRCAAKYATTFLPPLLFTAIEAISFHCHAHTYLPLPRQKVDRIYVKLFMTDGDDFPLFATFIN